MACGSIFSCRDEYIPHLDASDRKVLIVEGFLNAGDRSGWIKLSRSLPIAAEGNQSVWTEWGATVVVEGEDNSVQPLPQDAEGLYSGPLTLQAALRYRVRIKTHNNHEYLSEPMEVKESPPIDSIGFNRINGDVVVHVNTHDNSGQSVYYRWEFDETWEINTHYFSNFIYENRAVRRRRPGEERSVCYKYGKSTNVIIGSSARLQADRISQQPLIRIPRNDEKLSVRYSILVRQHVLDKNGYAYFDLLKKNTEQIGSVFDPQPSELTGNFRCISDPGLPVTGYINAGSISEKRFFIRSAEVPGWNFYLFCPSKIVTPDSIDYYFAGEGYIPYAVKEEIPGTIDYYLGSYPRCVDCTTRQGSLERPSYW